MGRRYIPKGHGSDNKALPFFSPPSNISYSPTGNLGSILGHRKDGQGWEEEEMVSAGLSGRGWRPRAGAAAPRMVELRKGQERREAEVRDNSVATCFRCGWRFVQPQQFLWSLISCILSYGLE